MTTHQQDAKMIEKMLEREAKNDAAALKHAVRDLEAADKAETKAEKMVDRAIHAHEKTVRKEHDSAKALNKAQHAHDARVADEQSALKTIELKKQHQARLEQDVEAKRVALEEMQKRKETNDALRDQKIVQLHTRTGTGGTAASDPAAQNMNVPVTQSPATTVGPSAA
ncbi:hypothetical protein RSOLAG22IIIB_01464 [Rhizoctonia solani]|uniref:Uncharacterized protein n=1 Tax=Rhizoctonia solani TaxID=456999 RepID=A0A0K6G5S5_9AGAM|nr:unnamed protein product [Rhizoctonia solani]CUA73943.1 hypothetical protein RSOLAG22IIIB_01464 [Rhizoctonia solani]